MSHYSHWHLTDDVDIKDIDGLRAWLDELAKTEKWDGMVSLIRIYEYERVTSETSKQKIVEKRYSFTGFYPEQKPDKDKDDYYYSNGIYGINHFEPRNPEHLDFIAKLGSFMSEEMSFFVFEEGWPTMDAGYATYVVTEAGKATATPLQLMLR